MRNVIRTIIVLSTVSMLLFSFFIVGCGGGPNEKELQALEESKTAALSAEEAQADCESEKADLESKLAAKQNELSEMKQEKTDVSNRLKEM